MERKSAFAAYAYNGGIVFITVAVPFVVLLQYGGMLGASFAGTTLLTSLAYWTLIVCCSFVWLPYLFLVLGDALGKSALVTCSLVFFAFSIPWQVFAVIYYGLVIGLTCENDILCADNLSYVGTVTGPYGGPSVRFLFVVASMAAAVLVQIGALIAAFSVRNKLIQGDLAAAGYMGAAEGRRRVKSRSNLVDKMRRFAIHNNAEQQQQQQLLQQDEYQQ